MSDMTVTNVLKNHIQINEINNSVEILSQLESKLYSQVRVVLNRLGGKWSVSSQSFKFEGRPVGDLIERALSTGTRRLNKFHYYPTPTVVFDAVTRWTSLEYIGASGPCRVLEPSIGEGALAEALLAFGESEGRTFMIDGIEIDPLNAMMAERLPVNISKGDFLNVEPEAVYDLVLMNPPFNGTEYIKHIQHAQKFLKPNGKLISVVPKSFTTTWTKCERSMWLYARAQASGRSLLNSGDFFPENTFKGVSLPTTIIEIDSEEHYQSALISHKGAQLSTWLSACESESTVVDLLIGQEISRINLGQPDDESKTEIRQQLNRHLTSMVLNLFPELNIVWIDDAVELLIEHYAPSYTLQPVMPPAGLQPGNQLDLFGDLLSAA